MTNSALQKTLMLGLRHAALQTSRRVYIAA